ncbi:LPXTG cell wall anchor domain-containing protein [Ligilactobacillus salivarius]|uniref:LPXTG cell wall anchor domain-containing protein n=1 Tax=Ligilactobacillus salivarius TaxID=1624 RepID=A0ABD7YY66_9LACO|nr:LPXTG cell wall anchor domain-containing protein [Ligilactobacillus salivarius]WHS10989.1 LPXTG cell wall anchor domain-containing protein [Ligilactobacillus salivarius]WHS15402.1 LPXTG cell wall anchor domain-containing protein [Ligilactobacillus salivarius]WHS18811.1 LPXTG cell wall anchor domain-containing protein [Ligilactobacillus salivarius]
MAKNNLINNSADSITRKKMYKSGKNWVVATLTAASLTGMVLVSNLKVADADSVTPTSPSTGSSDTTSSDKSATYSVTVDHSQLDNSVKQAQSTGVQIKQNPTTSTVVESNEASKAVDSIAQNYQQQTNEVKQATERQTVKNETYAKDVVDANSTNADNKAKIDEAVKNLQNAGGRASHNASKDSTVKANIDNYDNKKNEVNTSVNNVVKQIQDATDRANANNVVSGAVANKSDFNKAVQNAKNVLGSNNVIQDKAVSYGKVTPSNSSSISQSIKDDYAKQTASINTTVKQYQDAVSAAGSISKDELENAVKNAQNILGKNNVSQDPTVTKTTTVGNTKATVDEVNQDYKSQVTNINNKVKQYQDAKQAVSSINSNNLDSAIRNAQSTPGVKLIDDGTQNVIANVNNYADKKATVERDNQQQADNINAQVQQYKSDLQNYLNKINNNSSIVSSNEIIQNLTLANEWDAKVSYQVIGNNIKQSSQTLKTGDTAYGHGISIPQGKQITLTNFISDHPQTFKVIATFTGLKNSSYQGRKITKLVEVYTITPNTSSRENALGIYSDPTNGFEETNSKVNVSYEFYYEDGTPVNFKKGTAYLALGSLNNYQNGQDHYEYAKVISGGKALGLAGSSVSVHNGNTLYSTYPNTARESEYGADSHYNTNPQHSPDFDKYYGWDTGWVNSKAFYGSGLVSLEGSKYTFEVGVDGEKYFTTDELRNNLPANHLWYNMATVIPRTDIQKPELTVHYHHTNVELQQPEAVHYHLDSVTVEKPTVHYHENSFTPGDTNVVPFSYTNISVDTPTPETASYNYSDLLVKHKTTKSDSVKANNTDVKMDGKTVVAGSKLTYKIETDDFQASTGTTTATRKPTKSYVIVDKLPNGTTPDINKITVSNTATKQDLTKNFTISFDNATNTVRLEANDALIKMINADLTKTYPKLEQNLPVTVTGKVINLNNTAKTIIDGIETGSNIVTNEVTTSTPEKTVNIGNNNADGKYSITNDTQKYVVTVDYSRFANVIVSDDIAKKELSFTDNMVDKNNVAQLNTDSIKLLDKDGKAVDSNLYTPTVTKTAIGYSIKFTVKDPVKFIKTYGGQKLNLEYTVRTRDGVTGDVSNTIIQNNFDVIYSGNTTTVHVIDINPKKDVVSSIGSTESLNGKTVPINSVIYYRLDSSNLPANRATNVNSWSFKDPLDNKVVATGDVHILANGDLSSGSTSIKKNDDITKYFNINYDKGVYTISPTDEYKSLTNKTTNKANSYSIYIGAKVVKAGWAVNTATEELNGDNDKTNEVKTFSFDPVNPDPKKDASIGHNNNQNIISINGMGVTKGDTISYQLKGQPLVQYHETINKLSAVDRFDEGIKYEGYHAYLFTKDGKKIDVTDMLSQQIDNNTVQWTAKDALLKLMNSDEYNTKESVTPTIIAYAKVTADGVKNIENTYTLYINGKTDISNIVTNHTNDYKPGKSETVAGNNSDGKTVITNDKVRFDVAIDLKGLNQNTAISDEQLGKGIYVVDRLQDKNHVIRALAPEIEMQLTDSKGNVIKEWSGYFGENDTKDQHVINLTLGEKGKLRDFLKKYGGQVLHLTYYAYVEDGKSGDITNQATVTIFGNNYSTNVTKNTIKDINPHKDIVVNAGDTTSIDGSTVPLNSTYNYKLESSDLSDNRATVANKWSVNDKIDVEHVATTNQWKVLARYDLVGKDGKTIKAGTDISTLFDYNYKDGVVTITPKVDYLALVNNDKNRATKQGWDAYVQVKVIKAGWVSNTFNENFNDDEDKSNEVKTFSFDPINPKGNKDVNSGEVRDNLDKQVSINGKQVVPGDIVSFQLKGQPLVPYHETVKEFKAEDTLSDGLEYLGYKAFIVGDDGKQVDVTSIIKATKSDKTVTYVETDELNKLLNSDEYNTKASKTPTIVLYAKVAKYFSGKIDNNYKLYINGKSDISNTVEIENKTPNPVKDDKNEDGVDINGKAVPRGTTNVFYLHWNASQYKDAIATKDAIQKGFYYVDDYPDDALQAPSEFDIKDDTTGKFVDGFTTMNYASLEDAPKEIQDMLKANGIEVKGAFVVISANDPQKFFDTYVKAGHNLTIELPLTLRNDFKAGSYKNRAFEIDFGEGYPTNEVENTVIKTTPDKDVVDDNGKSVKDKYVTAGDIMHYVGTWDLTEYKNFALTKDQIAKGLSIFDDYDENILEVSDLNKQALTIIDSTTNKAIDMSMVEVNWDDAHGKWTVSAKDPQKFLETYGGHALKINFFAKVKKDAKGDIKNKIVQNDFGNETETDVVTNHVSVSDPTKDVVVSLTNSHSLNNSKVKLGDTLYYKLGSKTREAGEAYDTTSWGFVDKLDITHDLYTGQALVKARYDIKLKDGSAIKAGDDITKYFDITYDAQTGEFKVMAKKEFLDIINSDDNKATKQGFDVYLQAKRIKAGDVENTGQEIYNGEVINTNTVKTHTDESEKPKPEVPQVPQTPQTPTATPKAVETKSVQPELAKAPVQKASVLPQTGDSKDSTLAEVGLLAVALAGGIGLAGYKKKKTE